MKKAISVKGMASTHAEAVSGTSQKIAVEMMAPSIQNTQVRWARLPKIWSVAQPATTMPRLPPTNSKTATMMPATATDTPFEPGRSIIPQSSIEKRTM